MTQRSQAFTALALTATAVAGGVVVAAPASAGGIGDFLSPAFGTSCANHQVGAKADGATTHSTGSAGGNLAGLPLTGALNQCGGADLPGAQDMLGQLGQNAPLTQLPQSATQMPTLSASGLQ